MLKLVLLSMMYHHRNKCMPCEKVSYNQEKFWISSAMLTFGMQGNSAYFFGHLMIVFKIAFSKHSFRKTIRVPSSLDPDLAC